MIMWGISWPSNHILAEDYGPIDLGIFRYAFVIVSLIIVLKAIKTPMKIARQGFPFLITAGVLMFCYNYTFLEGLHQGHAGAGGILVTTMNPLMAYALGMLVDWRRPTRNEFIGLGLGLIAGLILLKIWTDPDKLLDGGNLFFLLSAFLWSIMSKFTSKSAKYGSPLAFTWWMYIVTFACLLPFMHTDELTRMANNTDLNFWGNLFFVSVIVTSGATTMYFFATSKIGAEKASSYIFTVPFTAAISAYFILGEAIEPHTIVGGLIGIGAVYMINRKAKTGNIQTESADS